MTKIIENMDGIINNHFKIIPKSNMSKMHPLIRKQPMSSKHHSLLTVCGASTGHVTLLLRIEYSIIAYVSNKLPS